MASSESKKEYISRLKQNPARGEVIVVRVSNQRSVPMEFQIEPTGDEAPIMEPDVAYEIVTQGRGTGPFSEEGYALNVVLQDDSIQVWVECWDGQAFDDKETSVAY
ncbi:MAG: hypothetical protein ABIO92_10790 [Chloroflexia bacterium]